MLKHLLLFSVAVLLIFQLARKETIPHNQNRLSDSGTILAVGDSLTKGFGAAEGESYPAILSDLLGRQVINAGVNGETSEEGLYRLPVLLQQYHPALTIICFGGNDILQKRSMSALKANLIRMVKETQDSGSKVLLISVPNLTLFGLEPLDLYEEVAEETEVPLLEDIISSILDTPSLKSDQIHPNAQGYRKMAEAIYHKIQKSEWAK